MNNTKNRYSTFASLMLKLVSVRTSCIPEGEFFHLISYTSHCKRPSAHPAIMRQPHGTRKRQLNVLWRMCSAFLEVEKPLLSFGQKAAKQNAKTQQSKKRKAIKRDAMYLQNYLILIVYYLFLIVYFQLFFYFYFNILTIYICIYFWWFNFNYLFIGLIFLLF